MNLLKNKKPNSNSTITDTGYRYKIGLLNKKKVKKSFY